MLKLLATATLATIAFVAPATAAQAALGPDAAACRAGSSQPAVLVKVSGFKQRAGRVRVQLYGGKASDFLAKGKYVRRIDLPVSAATMPICVALPNAGNYAVAVRHDMNGNGKSGDRSDGGGFSRNPNLSLLRLKPRYNDVAISVGNGVKPVDVTLNYLRGLSIGPVNES